MDEGTLRELESVVEIVSHDAGEVLLRQGDDADRLFVVLDGRLAIAVESDAAAPDQPLGEVGPGEIVGEVALLAGTRRTVTVRALTPVRLGQVLRDEVRRLVASHPDLVEQLLVSSVRRLRRSQFAAYLARMFGTLDPRLLDALEPRVEWVRLGGGQVLFAPGDPGDALYIVLSGRVRVIGQAQRGRQQASVEEIGRGQPIGTTAVLTGRPRNATVMAIRDTELAGISRATLRWFMEQFPGASFPIMRELADRLERGATAPLVQADRAATFAIIAHPGVDIDAFVARLSSALRDHGRTLVLGSVDAPQIAGLAANDGVGLSAGVGEAGAARWTPLNHWLDEREAAHDFVIYVSDPDPTAWTDQCLRQADQVVIVADAASDPAPHELESRLDGRWAEMAAPRRTLVLLQPDELPEPRGTARWLEPRSLDQHIHVRRSRAGDYERLGRFLSGNAISLVLGGGGALGYAHIGVLRAFRELDIPIDMVGGTSMGALIGAGVAREWMPEHLIDVYQRAADGGLFDPTPPVVSLVSGRRIWRAIDGAYGGIDVEDTWLPFFCVSTNLTRAEPVIHRRGSLSRAIRASASLPAVLPPVYVDGELLIDGGLLDTVPVGAMRGLNGGGPVIAIDVAPPVDLETSQPIGDHLSGWRALVDRLRHRRRRARMPGIVELMSRTVEVPGIYLQRQTARTNPDLLIRPPVGRWGTMDFRRVRPISEAGYQSALPVLREWWASRRTDHQP